MLPLHCQTETATTDKKRITMEKKAFQSENENVKDCRALGCYGITDLYSSSFHPFPTEEERWAYWARHIWFARFRPQGTKLYHKLRQLVAEKDHFVLTTNVDAQFEKSGFAPTHVFATQGDYAYLQARSGNPQTLVYNEQWVEESV